ncbi:MAG: HAD-IA family hydrolase [Actinomycetales bacterium]|nr:HAD-IA family hydrolase [Actinomycetales bacterium]
MSPDSIAPSTDTEALLFDCDGTLVDTMSLHRLVWTEIFARYDFAMTSAWWDQYANVALLPFVRAAIPDADDALAHDLNRESIGMFMERLHLIDPLEHVIEVARQYHGRLPLAVVTGGYRDVVVPTLDAAGITDLFDIIVTADDVVNSKPAPDLYALAAQRLGVDPQRCLAYEDSDIGMASARDAGIGRVVDIRDWPI